MANSKRFHDLKKRLSELRKHFLPRRFSPIGSYSDRQLDMARAYRLLAHAEIESFVEDISRTVVMAKIGAWKKSRKPSDVIICFLASYHSGWNQKVEGELLQDLIASGTQVKAKDTAEEAVDMAMKQYIAHINSNNGVRQDNLQKLFTPLGVRFSDLDSSWLVNIDDFGKLRGDIAHKTVSLVRAIDPYSELQRIVDLTVGLKKLDEIVLKL
jgi:hypothetical protein